MTATPTPLPVSGPMPRPSRLPAPGRRRSTGSVTAICAVDDVIARKLRHGRRPPRAPSCPPAPRLPRRVARQLANAQPVARRHGRRSERCAGDDDARGGRVAGSEAARDPRKAAPVAALRRRWQRAKQESRSHKAQQHQSNATESVRCVTDSRGLRLGPGSQQSSCRAANDARRGGGKACGLKPSSKSDSTSTRCDPPRVRMVSSRPSRMRL